MNNVTLPRQPAGSFKGVPGTGGINAFTTCLRNIECLKKSSSIAQKQLEQLRADITDINGMTNEICGLISIVTKHHKTSAQYTLWLPVRQLGKTIDQAIQTAEQNVNAKTTLNKLGQQLKDCQKAAQSALENYILFSRRHLNTLIIFDEARVKNNHLKSKKIDRCKRMLINSLTSLKGLNVNRACDEPFETVADKFTRQHKGSMYQFLKGIIHLLRMAENRKSSRCILECKQAKIKDIARHLIFAKKEYDQLNAFMHAKSDPNSRGIEADFSAGFSLNSMLDHDFEKFRDLLQKMTTTFQQDQPALEAQPNIMTRLDRLLNNLVNIKSKMDGIEASSLKKIFSMELGQLLYTLKNTFYELKIYHNEIWEQLFKLCNDRLRQDQAIKYKITTLMPKEWFKLIKYVKFGHDYTIESIVLMYPEYCHLEDGQLKKGKANNRIDDLNDLLEISPPEIVRGAFLAGHSELSRQRAQKRQVIKPKAFETTIAESEELRTDWEMLQESSKNVDQCKVLKEDINRSTISVGNNFQTDHKKDREGEMRKLMETLIEYTGGDVELATKAFIFTNQTIGTAIATCLKEAYVDVPNSPLMVASVSRWRSSLPFDIARDEKNGHLKVKMHQYWKVMNMEASTCGYIKASVEVDINDDTTTVSWTKPTDQQKTELGAIESEERQEAIKSELEELEAHDIELRELGKQ